MSQVQITMDFYTSLEVMPDSSGQDKAYLFKSGYMGQESSPSFQEEVTLESVLNEYIQSHSIPSNPPQLRQEYKDEILAGLDVMLKAVEDAKARVNQMEIIQ